MEECPVCKQTKLLVAVGECRHETCFACSNEWEARANTCPLCRGAQHPRFQRQLNNAQKRLYVAHLERMDEVDKARRLVLLCDPKEYWILIYAGLGFRKACERLLKALEDELHHASFYLRPDNPMLDNLKRARDTAFNMHDNSVDIFTYTNIPVTLTIVSARQKVETLMEESKWVEAKAALDHFDAVYKTLGRPQSLGKYRPIMERWAARAREKLT